jgi:hypothetical protein
VINAFPPEFLLALLSQILLSFDGEVRSSVNAAFGIGIGRAGGVFWAAAGSGQFCSVAGVLWAAAGAGQFCSGVYTYVLRCMQCSMQGKDVHLRSTNCTLRALRAVLLAVM